MKLPVRFTLLTAVFGINGLAHADDHKDGVKHVPDSVIAEHNKQLSANTKGKGFGPQSPRDIDAKKGMNRIAFEAAPGYNQMNLCNIHFHKHAEHKGGEFTTYAGNGDGKGYHTGYRYDGKLSEKELTPLAAPACNDDKGGLVPGDTIELHYVHTSAQVKPGPTLGACLSESIKNPQLRVEAQVFVLVNDGNGADFGKLAENKVLNGYQQAVNLPTKSGKPVTYAGSTTGPSFNTQGSPLQVTWNVRPKVIKVDAKSVDKWCQNNIYNEKGAHGVRNLVTDLDLLSRIR